MRVRVPYIGRKRGVFLRKRRKSTHPFWGKGTCFWRKGRMLFFFVLNEALWIKWIIFDLSFSIFEIKHYFCGMLRIVGHIEHLLSVHDCVIVPDFGGFVVQTLPVRYDAGMHRFEPMRKDIVFNETLQYNDGLLIEAYMQAEKTDYRTARQLMHEDVALLRAGLQRDGVLKMENIGSFSMGEEGQLIFQADEAGWLNAPMLGLEDFTFEPLSEQMPEAMALPEKKKAEIYYIPVSRRLVRVVAATAASVALFLAVSTPVKEVNRSAYTASFVPTEMIAPEVWTEKKSQPVEMPKAEMKPVVKEEKVADAPKAEVKKTAEAKPAPKPAPISQKMYHVVIASFPTSEQAKRYMDEAGRQDCPNMNMVHNKSKYRVYAERFTDRKTAEEYMEKLRKNPKYKDAWLFISR